MRTLAVNAWLYSRRKGLALFHLSAWGLCATTVVAIFIPAATVGLPWPGKLLEWMSHHEKEAWHHWEG